MFSQLKSFLITGGLSREDYFEMLRDLKSNYEVNNKNIAMTISLCCALISCVYSVFGCSMCILLHLYTIAVLYSLIYFFFKARNPFDNVIAFEIIMALGIAYGLVISCYSRDRSSFAIIGILMLLSLTSQFRPITATIPIFAGCAAYIIITLLYRDPSVWRVDLLNIISFGIMTCVIQSYSCRIKIQLYLSLRRNKQLARKDNLTELNNRTAYTAAIAEYAQSPDNLPACIYIDINGLHELNNTLGHDAGDKLIKTVASVLADAFSWENLYRIGGDEFVAFTAPGKADETKRILNEIKQKLAEKKYFISVGYGEQDENNTTINEIIRAAEVAMFNDKSDYYIRNKIDRRRKVAP